MTSVPSGLLAGRRGLILGVSAEASAGYQCAAGLRALGAEVTIGHRPERRAAVEELAQRIGCDRVEFDVLDENSLVAAFEQVENRYGALDFVLHTLVHVPDGALQKSVLDLSREEFALSLEVGARSLLVICKYARSLLARSPSPRVVALTSSGAAFTIPNYHLVGITKAALESALRYVAAELGRDGVLCNLVEFSIVDTAAATRVIGRDRTAHTRAHLAKRAMTERPVEYSHVVNAVAYLVSAMCENMTGETLRIDGGFARSYF